MALERLRVRIITRKRSGKDLHTFNGYFFYKRYLPRDPIGWLLGFDALVVIAVLEVLQPVQDQNDASILGSTAVSFGGLRVTTCCCSATWAWATLATLGTSSSDGITDKVKAPAEVDSELVVDDVNEAGLHIREGSAEFNEGAVNKGLVLALTGWGSGHVH